MDRARRLLAALALGVGLGQASCAGVPLPLTAEGELARGIALHDAGDHRGAVEHLRRALERDPRLGDAYLYLARSQLALGDWRAALGTFQDALARLPAERRSAMIASAVEAFIAFALGLVLADRLEEATAVLAETARLVPDSAPAREALAASLLAYGRDLLSDRRWSDAITQFRRALELAPGEIAAYVELARALLSSGELARALEALRDALRLAPEHPEANDLLGRLLRV